MHPDVSELLFDKKKQGYENLSETVMECNYKLVYNIVILFFLKHIGTVKRVSTVLKSVHDP